MIINISKSITNKDSLSLKLFLKEVSKIPMLSPSEELEIANKAKSGDELAKKRLVEANLRFAISIAKQFQGRGVPLIDLIEEAAMGLCHAVNLFEPDRGFKFISYAVWWSRMYIMQAINKHAENIRVPLNSAAMLSKIKKIINEFQQANDRQPSFSELSEILGIPEKKVISLLSISTKCVSVDTPFTEDSDSDTLIDIIPNNNPKADEDIDKESTVKEINRVIGSLKSREQTVIRLFFGIGVEEMPIQEIAKRFGVTTERIRQIKEKSLKKLYKKYGNELKDLL